MAQNRQEWGELAKKSVLTCPAILRRTKVRHFDGCFRLYIENKTNHLVVTFYCNYTIYRAVVHQVASSRHPSECHYPDVLPLVDCQQSASTHTLRALVATLCVHSRCYARFIVDTLVAPNSGSAVRQCEDSFRWRAIPSRLVRQNAFRNTMTFLVKTRRLLRHIRSID